MSLNNERARLGFLPPRFFVCLFPCDCYMTARSPANQLLVLSASLMGNRRVGLSVQVRNQETSPPNTTTLAGIYFPSLPLGTAAIRLSWSQSLILIPESPPHPLVFLTSGGSAIKTLRTVYRPFPQCFWGGGGREDICENDRNNAKEDMMKRRERRRRWED